MANSGILFPLKQLPLSTKVKKMTVKKVTSRRNQRIKRSVSSVESTVSSRQKCSCTQREVVFFPVGHRVHFSFKYMQRQTWFSLNLQPTAKGLSHKRSHNPKIRGEKKTHKYAQKSTTELIYRQMNRGPPPRPCTQVPA